jgi:hypothetical protein
MPPSREHLLELSRDQIPHKDGPIGSAHRHVLHAGTDDGARVVIGAAELFGARKGRITLKKVRNCDFES